MTHASLFSGIGGFDLAAEWMGWENLFHCEWNPFGQQVLKHHFPNSISYNDITKTDFSIHRGQVDILTGGFPCQPYSSAGKRLGTEDERHLWPEMLRTIQEVQPRWVVGENVLGLTNWNGGLVFNEVQVELEAKGYEVQAFILPACAKNAPHRRDRVWFVAYSNKVGFSTKMANGKLGRKFGFTKCDKSNVWDTFSIKSAICGKDDGLPTQLDSITISKYRKESLMAYGNAIVPQVAYEIFKAIEKFELMIN
jgi:DNA (cytosine-5)-methyltransferase 1